MQGKKPKSIVFSKDERWDRISIHRAAALTSCTSSHVLESNTKSVVSMGLAADSPRCSLRASKLPRVWISATFHRPCHQLLPRTPPSTPHYCTLGNNLFVWHYACPNHQSVGVSKPRRFSTCIWLWSSEQRDRYRSNICTTYRRIFVWSCNLLRNYISRKTNTCNMEGKSPGGFGHNGICTFVSDRRVRLCINITAIFSFHQFGRAPRCNAYKLSPFADKVRRLDM